MNTQPSYAEILLFQKVGENKDTLTYKLPENLHLEPGRIVEVPLRNRKVKGVIYRLHNNKPPYNTKDVVSIVNNAPHLTPHQLELIDWMANYYFCPKFRALKLFVPVSIVKKKKISAVNNIDTSPFKLKFQHQLSPDQVAVLKQFEETKKQVGLLHGITGSGKTEIYLHTVEKYLKRGKQVLILIPEISLSPQMQQRFEGHFHEQTRVIHSQLTLKQKEEAWLSIHRGDTKIIIGSRSALFAPFQNLGIIIIDEEHDHSYKQDQNPRYHAIKVAQKMANMLGIKVLMGSATPSIESYYATKKGTYELMTLNERPQKSGMLPHTKIVDLRKELQKKNFSIFSLDLQDKLEQKLNNKEQVLLFLNRRGAASAVICRVCGYIQNCDRCEIPMTYHKKFTVEDGTFNVERLICHHCGKIEKVPQTCPNCNSAYIKYIGLGTQRIEDELHKMYPTARIIRADRDTTQKRDRFKQIYETFKNGRADILVGTQMIAIGLHLPKINLVGIILADMGLTLPNFRASEQTFQLITQVSGRSGREQSGDAIIQTYLPNHYAIQAASKHDYKGFYEQEIKIRKELAQPPFSKLIKLTIKDRNSQKCINQTEQVAEILENINKQQFQAHYSINTYPALIPKLKDTYRWHVLISGKNPAEILKKAPPDSLKNVIMDVDPISTV